MRSLRWVLLLAMLAGCNIPLSYDPDDGCIDNTSRCLGDAVQQCVESRWLSLWDCPIFLGRSDAVCAVDGFGQAACVIDPGGGDDDGGGDPGGGDDEPYCTAQTCESPQVLCQTYCDHLQACGVLGNSSGLARCLEDCDESAADADGDIACYAGLNALTDCFEGIACEDFVSALREGVCNGVDEDYRIACGLISDEDLARQSWTCSQSFFGSSDGCDCGCGATDPDCPNETSSVCDFRFCDPGQIVDPNDNSRCIDA